MDSKSTLYLLDGMALAYRAHFAFVNSRLTNPEGIPTGPVLGFANTLDKLLETERPTHIAVAWDTHAKTFRHELDPEYKANRPPQPDELRTGIPLIKEMIHAYGIQNLELDGYEADDIIGTLADKANAEDVNVFLVTPDKDFMQLVHDHIKMVKPDNANGGFLLIGREEVKDYFGVYPDQVIDVLAIIGDASDNVPGVPGIGKKGAPALIQQFGSLEEAISSADQITAKKQREGLQQFADQALRAKEMVTIHTDVPGIPSWKVLKWTGPNRNELGLFFKRMAFRTLTQKYLDEGKNGDLFSSTASTGHRSEAFKPFSSGLSNGGREKSTEDTVASDSLSLETITDRHPTYTLIENLEELKLLVARLLSISKLCLDTETDSSEPMEATLLGISLAEKAGEAWYIPCGSPHLLIEDIRSALTPLFSDENREWIAQHMKFDWLVLRKAGIQLAGRVYDTMVAAYLLDASQQLSMDDLSRKYLGYDPIPIAALIGEGKTEKTLRDVEIEEVKTYACEDADITLQLAEHMTPLLEKDEVLDVARQIDFPLVPVLARMEWTGVRIHDTLLKEFSAQLTQDMQTLEKEIYELAGREFNIQSTQQLGEILFEELKLPSNKKTKTGRYSTSEEVLQILSPLHELPANILDYRSLSKLQSTYADALPKLIHPTTGRIHTNFNQTVTATGRLSSSNPNLQNIPIRTARGKEIRKAFIPGEGYRMLAADYSQVELRIIASIARDRAMIEAFEKGEDIHARTAREIFDLEMSDEVTADHRRKAKEVNFGIPYGVSAYGLASRLGISNGEGKAMIDRYFERFPGVKTYIEETVQFATSNGYVKTLSGRRRYIPDIHSRNWNQRGFAERTAINMPIQGTAADIIKLAMIAIDRELIQRNAKSRMVLQVHDELVFEVHEEELNEIPAVIQKAMERAYSLEVPLKVEMGIAMNWLDAHG